MSNTNLNAAHTENTMTYAAALALALTTDIFDTKALFAAVVFELLTTADDDADINTIAAVVAQTAVKSNKCAYSFRWITDLVADAIDAEVVVAAA